MSGFGVEFENQGANKGIHGIAFGSDGLRGGWITNPAFSAHDKKIKKSDKTRHNSNFFDELNHAKSYQT